MAEEMQENLVCTYQAEPRRQIREDAIMVLFACLIIGVIGYFDQGVVSFVFASMAAVFFGFFLWAIRWLMGRGAKDKSVHVDFGNRTVLLKNYAIQDRLFPKREPEIKLRFEEIHKAGSNHRRFGPGAIRLITNRGPILIVGLLDNFEQLGFSLQLIAFETGKDPLAPLGRQRILVFCLVLLLSVGCTIALIIWLASMPL